MKRFRFRLEQVLKLREQKMREAEFRQQQVQAQLASARVEVRAIEELLSRSAEALRRLAGRTSSVSLWANGSQHAARLNDALNAARERVMLIERRLREADQQRVAATTETESVLFLRNARWIEHRKAEARRTQQFLDEGALRRWTTDSRDRFEDERAAR